jgi:hypothetical protein
MGSPSGPNECQRSCKSLASLALAGMADRLSRRAAWQSLCSGCPAATDRWQMMRCHTCDRLAGAVFESSFQVAGLIYTRQETQQFRDFVIAIALREQIELDWRCDRKGMGRIEVIR